jgi:hypothetical protein
MIDEEQTERCHQSQAYYSYEKQRRVWEDKLSILLWLKWMREIKGNVSIATYSIMTIDSRATPVIDCLTMIDITDTKQTE